MRGELELTQTDRSLAGRFRSDQGDGRVSSGTATKDKVEFVVSIGAGDSAIKLKFDTAGCTPPTPAAGSPASPLAELHGNLKSPFGAPTKWSAKRIESKPTSTAAVQLSGIEDGIEATAASASRPRRLHQRFYSVRRMDRTMPSPVKVRRPGSQRSNSPLRISRKIGARGRSSLAEMC